MVVAGGGMADRLDGRLGWRLGWRFSALAGTRERLLSRSLACTASRLSVAQQAARLSGGQLLRCRALGCSC